MEAIMRESPLGMAARQEMEDSWRLRLEQAHEQYKTANAQYRRLLEEKPQISWSGQNDLLAQARQGKAEALAEFKTVLNSFSELLLHGTIPQEVAGKEREGVTASSIISVVDDDESIRDSTKALLRSAGYQTAIFASGEQFLDSGMLPKTSCLILDVRMPGMDGFELQRQLNVLKARVAIVFVTAHSDRAQRQRALAGGASYFFQKPVTAKDLLEAVETAVRAAQLHHILECEDGEK